MRVAYLWSPQLQALADQLPANKGRSARVHSLIRALDMLDEGTGETAEPESTGEPESNGEREPKGEPESNDPATDTSQSTGTSKSQTVSKATVVFPDIALATETELRRYHAPHYVDYLLRNGQISDGSGSDSDSESDGSVTARKRRRIEASGLEYDCPPFPHLGSYARVIAASTLTAARLLVDGYQTAIVWDGGRHHAQRARASGFCYVADAVLGILYLSRHGRVCEKRWRDGERDGAGGERTEEHIKTASGEHAASESTTRPPRRPRILYLDMDLHYGDGVALAFKSPTKFPYPLKGSPRPPQVLTLSVHHSSPIFFPPGAPGTTCGDTHHPFSLSYALAAYAHSPSYARAMKCIEGIADAWRPDYVVLQLGVDGLPSDPVGQCGAWGVTGEGSIPWVVERVMAWNRPTLVLGGGGYVNDNAARAWALATAAILKRGLDAVDEVPDHQFFDEYGPGYTLETPESHAPDENAPAALDAAEAEFSVLAERIKEIVALH